MGAQLTLPKSFPRPGTVHLLVVVKSARGATLEVSGTFDEAKALKIWEQIHEAEVKK